MKIILRTFFATILLLCFLSSSAHAQNKIATVNLRKLFDGYWKTKQAQSALDDKKTDLAKEDKGFIDDLKKARDEYQKLLESADDQAVSADERAKRKQAAADKLRQIKDSEDTITQFERQAQATLAEQSQRMRESILNEIRAAVSDKAKAGGYTFVLDADAQTINQTPFILFTSGENDLTAAVLQQINAGAPIEATKSSGSVPLIFSTNAP
jgi:Skp family chaperone for outer membrane proteins